MDTTRYFNSMLMLLLLTNSAYSQNADSLNIKSKEFLSAGDTKSAYGPMRRAAESGNAEAQYNLGYSYQQGIEVPQNDSIANLWLIKSANQGYINAQFKIAYSYAIGRGIRQDNKQAFYWASKCAWQNDAECIFNVIGCYMNGTGVEKNSDSTIIWMQRLGTLENPEDLKQSGYITSARLTLAKMYRDGDNVAKDLVKSYTWFLIYNEGKRDFSILEQQTQIDAIKDIESKLTAINKTQSKENAEKILNRSLKNLNNLHTQDY